MAIPKDCKRLAEVDFALSAINEACNRENNKKTRIDSRHPSLLHTWWARRPLASCRALLLGLLLPDPTDPNCPTEFKRAAREILRQTRTVGNADAELQRALLKFIAEFSEMEFAEQSAFLATARELVKVTHDENPQIFDPFSGGGSIPLEALRLGCDVTASELNPVAWLLLKIGLDWSARYGLELLDLFEQWSGWVLEEIKKRLDALYPMDNENRRPLAYLWARTVQCETPGCGVTVPLVRSLTLSQAIHYRTLFELRG